MSMLHTSKASSLPFKATVAKRWALLWACWLAYPAAIWGQGVQEADGQQDKWQVIVSREASKRWRAPLKTLLGIAGPPKSGQYLHRKHIPDIQALKAYTQAPYCTTLVANLATLQATFDQVPSQTDDWSCGPNAGARAIFLLGNPMDPTTYRYLFLPDIAFFHKDKLAAVSSGIALGSTVLGMLLAPFTGGISALVGSVGCLGGITGAVVGKALKNSAGTPPGLLAQRINPYLAPTQQAVFCRYRDFQTCAAAICQDIKARKPVIVFYVYNLLAMHFVNVVGVIEEAGLPTQFIIMDTGPVKYRRKIVASEQRPLAGSWVVLENVYMPCYFIPKGLKLRTKKLFYRYSDQTRQGIAEAQFYLYNYNELEYLMRNHYKGAMYAASLLTRGTLQSGTYNVIRFNTK